MRKRVNNPRVTHAVLGKGTVGPKATLLAPDEIGMNFGVGVLAFMSG
jgi:hypothetical protein